MAQQKSEKEKVVLLSVAKDMSQLKSSSESAGFAVFPVLSPAECITAIGNNKPDMIVHNLHSFEPSQVNIFQQRLARHESASASKRILLAPELSVSVLSLVADCGIRKAIQLASAMSNLGLRLHEITKEDKNRSAPQLLVHNLRLLNDSKKSADFDKAVEEAFASFPHDNIVRLEYGNLCFRRGQLDVALDISKRVWQIEPQNVRAINLLARCQMKIGDKETAIRLLEAANKSSPFNPERLTIMGDVLMQQGHVQDAKKKYLAALDIHPTSVDARASLAQCPLSEEEISSALKIFMEPLSEEERASFLNNSGIHALSQNRYQDAVLLYHSAVAHLKSAELKASVFYNLALAHKKHAHLDMALEAFHKCLTLNPNHPHARAHISELSSSAAGE